MSIKFRKLNIINSEEIKDKSLVKWKIEKNKATTQSIFIRQEF
jgi:hypothetical protein